MAYVCLFKSSKKKIVGDNTAKIKQDVLFRFPELQGIDFKVTYFDEDVKEFLDIDDEQLPPRGAKLRIEYEVVAEETERVETADSDATLFEATAVEETASSW